MEPFMAKAKVKNHEFISLLLDCVSVSYVTTPNGRYVSWENVLRQMSKYYPNESFTVEGIRNRYRRLTDIRVNQIIKRKDDRVAGRVTLEKRVLNEIKRKRPLEYVMGRLGITKEKLLATVAMLQAKGFKGVMVFDEEGTLFVHNRVRSDQRLPSFTKDSGFKIETETDVIRFGVVSDTHFGNMCANKRALSQFYKEMSNREIKTVLHAGDLTDGYYTNRPTSILEQYAVGFSAQLKDFVKDYPKVEGITTYAISGNHDETHMRNGFASMGEAVASQRDDIVYLGHNFGRVQFGNVTVSLIHPTDGVSQNYNKKIRDIIERSPERRSDIMLVGHYHKVAMLKHMGVNGYLLPSFERRTAFMMDNGLDSIVGGMVFEIHTDKKGNVTRIVTEVIEYDN